MAAGKAGKSTPQAAAAAAPAPAAPQWSALQPPPMRPAQSGLLRAAVVLLLVGAILWAAMALFILGMAVFFAVLFSALGEEAGAEGPSMMSGVFIGVFYGIWGLLAAGGSICGFVGWRKASRGDLNGGFVWGLVGSLLPPMNIVGLLGAIFVKVCPENEAQERARQGWPPPR